MRYLHPILMYPLSEFNWQAFCTLQAPWWGYKCHKYRSKTNIMNPIVPGSQKDGFGTSSVPELSHEPTADFSINAECLGHLIFCYDMVGKGFPVKNSESSVNFFCKMLDIIKGLQNRLLPCPHG